MNITKVKRTRIVKWPWHKHDFTHFSGFVYVGSIKSAAGGYIPQHYIKVCLYCSCGELQWVNVDESGRRYTKLGRETVTQIVAE